jgi:hypothetical protein
LNRVLRYVNWTAKQACEKSTSWFGDSISAGVPEIRHALSPMADTRRTGVGRVKLLRL